MSIEIVIHDPQDEIPVDDESEVIEFIEEAMLTLGFDNYNIHYA